MLKDYGDIGLAITNLGILALIAFALYMTQSILVFFGIAVLFVKKPAPIEFICKECGSEEQIFLRDCGKNPIAYQIAPLFYFWD